MTDRRYLADSTVRSFEATVERALDERVVLDATHFYPTGGGQPHDTGRLVVGGESVPVVDVQKKDTVYHTLDGEHLLSAVLLSGFDAPTVGNQLYADRARLDCSYDRFSETELADLEASLNGLVDAGLGVRHYTMARDRAETELDTERTRIDLLPDSISELRIVEVGDPEDPFDRTACAGTHVGDTAEIGTVTVTGRTTQGSDTERVSFELES